MNVGIGTVALSWEYLFRIFGIESFQCGEGFDVLCAEGDHLM